MTARLEPGEPRYLIRYRCTNCGHKWEDIWSCACDDECPECGTTMEALDYERLDEEDEDEPILSPAPRG